MDKYKSSESKDSIIFGRNPVKEALEDGITIDKVVVQNNGEGSIKKLVAIAREKNILVQREDKKVLDRLSKGGNHQGILAYTNDFEYCDIDDILEVAQQRGEEPFVLLLDGVEDPHNLGAIIRSAECVGVHGIIIPKRRSANVNGTVVKTSVGATQYMKIARVPNISMAIDKLKEKGLWIGACNMGGETLWNSNLRGPIGLILGSEGRGIGTLVMKNSDFVVSIPMRGRIDSLNVSNAATLVMYEVLRQRG